MSETFLVVTTARGGSTGWAEARDDVKYLTMHWTALTTRNYLAQNVNRAAIEKI